MIKVIAFDFDGVLVDSVPVKTKAFARLFKAEDPSMVERIVSYHLKNGGISRFEKFRVIYREILRRPLLGDTLQALGQEFERLVLEEVVNAAWIPGAREFLVHHADRYPIVIVSGTPEEELQTIVRRRAMGEFFAGVFGSPRSKDVLLSYVLSQYRIEKSEIVFVGDAETDWIAAQKVGIPFIWRSTGEDDPRPAGFHGMTITSLNSLEACLAVLERAASGSVHE